MSDLIAPAKPETPITTAAGVLAQLYKRWPQTEYVTVEEAPDGSDRMGRKIDLLVMSCWRSRGFEIDAVEVKVSMPDWKRELKDPQKGDFWWRHSNRFWLAVPDEMAQKVLPDLPETWGLLACSETRGPREIKKAPRHDAERLGWAPTLGIMRTISATSTNAYSRAYNRGRDTGYQEGLRELERRVGDTKLRAEVEQLRARIAKFEKTAGVTLDDYSLGDIATAVKIIGERGHDYVFGAAERLRDSLDRLLKERFKP